MSSITHSTLALVLASAALGASLGTALWLPQSQHACSHQPPPPAIESTCGLAHTPAPPIAYSPPAYSPPSSLLPSFAASPLEVTLRDLIPATAGHPVKPGDRALARWSDGNWWEARVEAVAQNTVRVAWLDGSPANDIARQHVAPLPAERPALHDGDVAMCKWKTSTRWWRARIHGHGDARSVLYIDSTVEPLTGQCVPAERGDVGFVE